MKTYKPRTLMMLLLLCTATAFAQNKKLEKTYKTNKDVKIVVDARHTNISFETWDKNEVQIEAYIDGKHNAEEAKALLNSWSLETSGNAGEVTIKSGGGMGRHPEMDMASLNESMGHLHNMLAPLMTEMVAPMLENIAKHPPLPPEMAAKMGNLNFDYEAYQKDGEKYMKKFEKEIEKNFGKDFEVSMEKWAAQFEKNAEVWGKNLEKEMEKNGEKFEKSMEKWAESFGAEMEKWGEDFAKQFEEQEGKAPKVVVMKGMTKANKFLKVKIPSGARIDLNVRHGEVNLGQKTSNLNANLSHSKLSANIIDGNSTKVQASYTPITVNEWQYGVLNTSYVQSCTINKAKSIKLTSNSSDVKIKEIEETGILSGTFGELEIQKLSPNFKTLDISLKNSDLLLNLPKAALNFNYNGSQSEIQYPKVATIKSSSSYDNEILNGYYGSGSANRNISINATFSDIIIK